jgi:hypothetical protein
MSDVPRNYKIVGLTRRKTVIIEVEGGPAEDSGTTATAWVGDRAALQPGGVFDYFTPKEKQFLREGLRR